MCKIVQFVLDMRNVNRLTITLPRTRPAMLVTTHIWQGLTRTINEKRCYLEGSYREWKVGLLAQGKVCFPSFSHSMKLPLQSTPFNLSGMIALALATGIPSPCISIDFSSSGLTVALRSTSLQNRSCYSLETLIYWNGCWGPIASM